MITCLNKRPRRIKQTGTILFRKLSFKLFYFGTVFKVDVGGSVKFFINPEH